MAEEVRVRVVLYWQHQVREALRVAGSIVVDHLEDTQLLGWGWGWGDGGGGWEGGWGEGERGAARACAAYVLACNTWDIFSSLSAAALPSAKKLPIQQ